MYRHRCAALSMRNIFIKTLIPIKSVLLMKKNGVFEHALTQAFYSIAITERAGWMCKDMGGQQDCIDALGSYIYFIAQICLRATQIAHEYLGGGGCGG